MFNKKRLILSFLPIIGIINLVAISASCSSDKNSDSMSNQTKPKLINVKNSWTDDDKVQIIMTGINLPQNINDYVIKDNLNKQLITGFNIIAKSSDEIVLEKADISLQEKTLIVAIKGVEEQEVILTIVPKNKNDSNQELRENSSTSEEQNHNSATLPDENGTIFESQDNLEEAKESKILEIAPGEYLTNNVEKNFKNIIFNKELVKYFLPSKVVQQSEQFFSFLNDEDIIKGILMGYSITKQPTITEADDEKGSARIQCSLSRGNEVKEIDYVYNEFLTTKQKEINDSQEFQAIVDNWIKEEITLKLKEANSYNIDDYKDKTVKELLTSLQFDDESTRIKKVLLENKNKIEGLDKKVQLYKYHHNINTFSNFIQLINNKGQKSTKIKLIITDFLGSSLEIKKEDLWFNIFQSIWKNIKELSSSLLATEVTDEMIWKNVFKWHINEFKIPLSPPDPSSYALYHLNFNYALMKIKNVANPNDTVGSLDITFELKIVKDGKEIVAEDKMLTVYGFKTK